MNESRDRRQPGTDRLLLFARYPEAGRVKTRLVPPLDHEQAAMLYRAFLLDAVELFVGAGSFELVVCVADVSDVERMRRLLADELAQETPVPVRAQSGGDLGERMRSAIAESLDEGCARVCVVGSDHPSLPLSLLLSAFDRSIVSEVVIGRADDGGYWLIGMERPHDGLFAEMPWSSPGLYRATLERAGSLGLAVAELGTWYDVDEWVDLERIWSERATAPVPPRTMTALAAVMEPHAGQRTMEAVR